MGEVQHLVYGRDADTPTDTAIRGAALDTIRTARATRISSEHRIARALQMGETQEARIQAPTPSQLRKLLRHRLTGAIISDWVAAVGTLDGAHGKGDADIRAHRRRPHDMTEFLRRWGSVCEMVGYECRPKPRWLERGHRAAL